MPTDPAAPRASVAAGPGAPWDAARAFALVSDEVVRRYDVAGPRYTSYPTVPDWSADFGADDYGAALTEAGASAPDTPLSLYVHLPFCRELCAYCGCNVVVGRDASYVARYLDAVDRELALAAERLGRRRRLCQVHLGGGTPTFLDEGQLARLWGAITRSFTPDPGAEIALEAHPAVTRNEQLDLLAGLGFNRLSMGVQDLDPTVQEAVRRRQDVERIRGLLEHAREVGFTGVNFDLIYGLPHQTPESWRRTLQKVVEMRPDRLAIYSFAYVPDVRPHQRRLDAEAIPFGMARMELLRGAHEVLGEAGYAAIGMDHFAVPSDDLSRAAADGTLTRNFMGYVSAAAPEIVAFGITGISDVGGVYAQGHRGLGAWFLAIEEGGLPTARGLRLTPDDHRRRRIIADLMCRFEADLGEGGEEAFAEELKDLARPDLAALVDVQGARLSLTPLGHLFVRNVAMVFDAHLRVRQREGGRAAFSRTV